MSTTCTIIMIVTTHIHTIMLIVSVIQGMWVVRGGDVVCKKQGMWVVLAVPVVRRYLVVLVVQVEVRWHGSCWW